MIGIDPTILDKFDRKWKLVVCAGCYWTRECRPSNHFVKALVLCLLFCSRDKDPSSLLPSHRVREERTGGKWLDALHSFSSFQCIYLDLAKLNNILVNPLLFVSPAFLFDGRLIQFYACKKDIDGIAERNFKASLLYANLLETFTSFLRGRQKSTDTAGKTEQSATSTTEKAKKQSKPKPPPSITNNPFAMLMEDSSDDSNDD